ncbi:hypothetical protein IWW55_000046 [Coemansia sp. RSA 2706]|nr:hypothetical protein LPJ63_000469 [Coemansia sp. RSA 2711]KAJ1842259.1 hypothetical protein LPJ70_003896 [Coemansia sp. RSA 2708]KAJ2309074.1 hypothetical protein IWW55_000046 [Coemansia sp. RSA 2706]KAJ2315800.1 hypothetical protein IWW54_000042 [Coemansia sp. RSA 2705]KAJ2322504.1 hypothetical protein IWW52_000040 [Coemansia sp. RSA 2704]KAJ2330283.1 hypothetical protein IWW51_000039 [Coemansia sp. RSA 2702]KAJ2372650.1 hypothetical protein H4S02_009130 [Coemansia sp. RSA 2611]KAJ274000
MEASRLQVPELFSVKDKVVVVTGGGSGIGLMVSQGFVNNGAHVYIVSRKASVLEQVARELTAQGPGRCTALGCDLQGLEQTHELAATIRRLEPQGVDVLVNNSGATWGAESLESHPDAAFTKLLTLNVQRVFTLTQQLLGALEQRGGVVINVGSVDGIRVPASVTPAYSASKAAVHHLTRVLAAQLAGRNVRVNAVAPGAFQSRMMKKTLERVEHELVRVIPARRIGCASDMAGVCIFLASRAGAYVNGVVLPVDGGTIVGSQACGSL